MSTMPVAPAPQDDPMQARENRKEARLRAAACRARLRLATDALAAADLLLGMNWSTRQCDAGKRP